MTFKLPDLPYQRDALEPYISKETIEYHYGKHHATYVTNLNNLIENTEFQNQDLETIICSSSGGIYNNAAQVWNHTFYWKCLTPNSPSAPSGKLAEKISDSFGSFEKFKDLFNTAAKTLFGSGWVFLNQDSEGKLEITKEPNAGCPLTKKLNPILTCDVWEHAYYIDYRNARPKYLESFWSLVNWDFVDKNLKN